MNEGREDDEVLLGFAATGIRVSPSREGSDPFREAEF